MSVLKRYNGTSWEQIGFTPVKTNNSKQIKNNSTVPGSTLCDALNYLENETNTIQPDIDALNQIMEQGSFTPNESIITQQLDSQLNSNYLIQNNSITINKIISGELPYVTPEQYGAAGDGETDDTEVIQDAIDSGFPVFFNGSKIYMVTELNLYNGCILYGNGATIKRANLKEEGYTDEDINNSYLINLLSEDIGFNYNNALTQIRDLNFDFNGFSMWDPTSGTNPYIGGVGIYCAGGIESEDENETTYWENILIDNCSFKNSYAPCVSCDKYVNLIMSNCYINNCYYININYLNNKTVLKNIKYNSDYDWSALHVGGLPELEEDNSVTNINIDSCNFFGGISIGDTFSTSIFNINISNCYILGDAIFQLQNENSICKINNCSFENMGSLAIENSGIISISGQGTITFDSCNFQTRRGVTLTGNLLPNSFSTKVNFYNCFFDGRICDLRFHYEDPFPIGPAVHRRSGYFKVIINNCYFDGLANNAIAAGQHFIDQEFDYCYITNCIFNQFDYIISTNYSDPIFNGGNNIIPTNDTVIFTQNKTIFKDEMWNGLVSIINTRGQNLMGFGSRTMYSNKLPFLDHYLNNVDIIQLTTPPYDKYRYINNEWVLEP